MDVVKLSALLAAVCLASGLALGFVYRLTEPLVERTERETLRASLSEALPQAAAFSEEKLAKGPGGKEIRYYEGRSGSGELVGYAVLGEKTGYQSLIRVLVGVNPRGVIQAVKVLQQAETPGLGTKVDEIAINETIWERIARLLSGEKKEEAPQRPWFQEQFDGLTTGELTVIKPPYGGKKGIHAITGATITSRAVTAAVRETVAGFMKSRGGRGDA